MRQSAFNHLTALPEGGFALYNFLTGTCLRLNVLSRDYYDNFDLYGEDCEQVRRLVNLGFLVDCDEHGIAYSANAITNGYFLDAQTAAVLDECRVGSLQITLDGPDAQTHDATRHLRSGGGTFERIMLNIEAFSGESEIVVRCNVHRGNAETYSHLEDRLLALGRNNNRQISVYPGHMDGCGSYRDMAMTADEFANFRRATTETVERVGYSGPICMVPKLLNFVVDERGNLYKCLESVGREDESFGNVRTFDFAKPQTGRMDVLSSWYDFAWPNDEECLSCCLLPVCLGGCPQRRREGAKECVAIKPLLDEYVIALAEELMHRDGS